MKQYKHKINAAKAIQNQSGTYIVSLNNCEIVVLWPWMIEESSDWEEIKQKEFKYKNGDDVIVILGSEPTTRFEVVKIGELLHTSSCFDYQTEDKTLCFEENRVVCKTSQGFISHDNEIVKLGQDFYFVNHGKAVKLYLTTDNIKWNWSEWKRFKSEDKAKEYSITNARLFSIDDIEQLCQSESYHITARLITESKKRLGYE